MRFNTIPTVQAPLESPQLHPDIDEATTLRDTTASFEYADFSERSACDDGASNVDVLPDGFPFRPSFAGAVDAIYLRDQTFFADPDMPFTSEDIMTGINSSESMKSYIHQASTSDNRKESLGSLGSYAANSRVAINNSISRISSGLKNPITSARRSMQEATSSEDLTHSLSSNCWASLSCKRARRTIALRDLNFEELTRARYGDSRKWKDLSDIDRVEIISEALRPNGILLDPTSDYMKLWDLVIILSLVFTALVAPYEMAFLSNDGFDFLYSANRVVDAIFVKDMIMQFFIKVKRPTRQGIKWIRDRREITKLYIKSWFVVDILSIVPYDLISDHFAHAGHSEVTSKLKIMRLLRALRLIKLVRIIKASRVFTRWENLINIRSATRSLIKFTVLIAMTCHWMACLWGFIGKLEGTNIVCRHELAAAEPGDERLSAFPGRAYFIAEDDLADPYKPDEWLGESWIVRFALGRTSRTPTDPCAAQGLYLVSMYWAVMTITSIGYGDIVPVTVIEYTVCSLCMMTSSIIWAYIIGAICSTMSTLDPEASEFEMRMDAFNAMAKDQGIPRNVQARGRDYIREERAHRHYVRNLEVVADLGSELGGVLSRHIACHWLDRIWFLKHCSVQFRQEVANKLSPRFYEKRVLISERGKLCVVERGAVGRGGRIMVPWGYWGDDILLQNKHLWSTVPSISLTYSEIMTLSREDFCKVLGQNEEEAHLIRRAAATVELARAAQVYSQCKRGALEINRYNKWIFDIFEDLATNQWQDRTPKLKSPRRCASDLKGDRLQYIEGVLDSVCRESRIERMQLKERQVTMQLQLHQIHESLKLLLPNTPRNRTPPRRAASLSPAVTPTNLNSNRVSDDKDAESVHSV